MKNSFVYRWVNKTKGKVYLGYHKGTLDDGYICSSKSKQFWKDWETDEWVREILFEGNQEECVNKESELLKNLDNTYYNMSINGKIIFTEEVRQKMRKPKKDTSKMGKPRFGKDNSFYGKKHSEETKQKMSDSAKKRGATNRGFKQSDEAKRKMSDAKKGKPWTEARRQAHNARKPQEL